MPGKDIFEVDYDLLYSSELKSKLNI